MKIFITTSGYFGMSIIDIKAIPVEKTIDISSRTCERIVEDLYNLTNGDGSISLEYMRTSERKNNCIRHMLIIRHFNKNEDMCKRIIQAAVFGINKHLQVGGYIAHEVDFEEYSRIYYRIDKSSTWALVKNEIREQDSLGMGMHISVPVISQNIDLDSIYSTLEESGCTISIQIIPDRYSVKEELSIQRSYASFRRALDGNVGLSTGFKDGMAIFGTERWQYYVEHMKSNICLLNILVMGPTDRAALVVARMKSILKERFTESAANYMCLPVNGDDLSVIYNIPWKCEYIADRECVASGANLAKKEDTKNIVRKYTVEEVSAIMRLPKDDGISKGISSNAFSLLQKGNESRENDDVKDGILIGTSIDGRKQYLSVDDFLLHVSVYGKTGVGKTTFMLSMIERLRELGKSVLVLDPAKKEYRVLAKNTGTKVFTVESDILPYVINPFYVPEGITLDEYKPHLFSAFNASFSMPDPLPSLFGMAISECYALYGWKGYSKSTDKDVRIFGLEEFVRVFKKVVHSSGYSSEVKGNMMSGGAFRLLSLIDRSKGTFETIHSIDVNQLLNGQVVLEMGRLEGEQKCLVAALTLISIFSYLKTTRRSNTPLTNVIVMDEAHVLLDNGVNTTEESKNVGNTMTKLIENLVAEIRALGVGVIIADQSPKRIGENLLDSTNTKILFRLTGDEADKAAKAVGLTEEEARVLPRLGLGEAILCSYKTPYAIGFRTIPDESTYSYIDDRLLKNTQRKFKKEYSCKYKPFQQCQKMDGCSEGCEYRVRELAHSIGLNIFNANREKIKSSKDLMDALAAIPDALRREGYSNEEDSYRLCRCVAVHFYRKIHMELGISIPSREFEMIMDSYNKGG